ncbi:MAG: DUF1330 domain-containing protein [Reichenbachiella sp.]|uniref:DUF1330 domain-containing protein n=1 Tax=Reichenbachiella sp. TaxID=2184521 RepID=UPI0032634C25
MSQENAVLVINAIVNKANMAEVPEYLGSVMKIFGQHGGKPIGRYKTTESISGDDSPEMVAILEFPSAETIKAMVSGSEFQSLGEQRSRVFSKLNMVICSGM